MDTVEFTEIELTDEQLKLITGGFDHDTHQHQQPQHEHEHRRSGHWIWWHHKRSWHWDD